MNTGLLKLKTASLWTLSFLLAAGLVLNSLSAAGAENENNNNAQNGNAKALATANAGGNGNGNGNNNAPAGTNGNGGTTAQSGGEGQKLAQVSVGNAAAGVDDLGSVKVTKVEGKLAFFNTVKVTVQNLAALLKAAGNDYSKIILYLDGYPLKGIVPRSGTEADQLLFDIRQTDNAETKKLWNSLLGRPTLPIPRPKPVSVGVGLEGKEQLPTTVKDYPLTVIDGFWYWVYLAGLVLLTFSLVRWAKNSDLLRVGARPDNGPRQRYSLGYCQMAFWFYVVAAAYVFIWMVSSEYRNFPGAILGLLGISAATALGASLINSSGPPVANPAVTAQPSVSFFTDITSDENGKVSFHRFQIVIWTLVLGIIFLFSVYNLLAMPEFPDTLLALMGISSGTYIGFKYPEKREAEKKVEAAAAGQVNNPPPNPNNPPPPPPPPPPLNPNP